MKAKLLFIILFFTSISIGFSLPSEKDLTYSKSDKLKQSLLALIDYPSEAINQQIEGLVMVDFTLTATGKAQINAINYSHIEFKDQVIKKLNKINREADPELIGKTFIYKFVFIRK
jgi:hypothetical protein